MKRLKQAFVFIGVFLLWTIPVKAEITPQLLQEWSKQPINVQWNLYNQRTNIQVVDQLPWVSPFLVDTYGYTTLNVQNGYVQSVDIYIKRGYEFALTHEVGHVLSDYARIPYWWAYNSAFIPIWQAERYNCALLVGQGEYDVREYFAEAYALFINYPLILKQCCPQTYNYICVVLAYT
jgi:hypothetical protein